MMILVGIVWLIAALLVIAGLIGIFSPVTLIGLVNRFKNTAGLYIGAVVRIGLGVVFWLVAPSSKAPLVFQILGIASILAGILLPVLGTERITKVLDWWTSLGDMFVRGWGLVVILVGGLLAYGVN